MSRVSSARIGFRFVLVAIALSLALGALEIGFRLTGFGYPNFYQPDPVLGSSLRPGASGTWTREGRGQIAINALGWRDIERTQTKPKGTFRVAIVGDSYVEALQVNLDEAFWFILQRHLRGMTDRELEVLPFGVSGFGTAQELLAYDERISKFSPDVVVVMITTGNDLSDNVRELTGETRRPFFGLEDGTLKLDRSFLSDPRFTRRDTALSRFRTTLTDYSRVVQVAYEGYRKIRQGSTPPAPSANTNGNWIYRAPADALHEKAWNVTEALLKKMAQQLQAQGVRLCLALVSNGIQVHPMASAREAFVAREDGLNLDYPNERFRKLGAALGVKVIDLVPSLRGHAERTQQCVHGFDGGCGGHWNQEGHRVVAETLAIELLDTLNTVR